jgi:hypothetical protein
MNPQKQGAEPNGGEDFNPFGDPRTIPTGWDVSAFYAPWREIIQQHGAKTFLTQSTPAMKPDHDTATHTI